MIKALIANKKLIAIIVLALIVRLLFINHGGGYIYNVDEPTFVRTTMGLRFTHDIDRFDWPHFSFYFHYVFYFIFIKFIGLLQILSLRPILEPILPLIWQDPFVFYVISRKLVAIFGALTIIPLYLLANKLFNNKTALLACLLFALIPQHIYQSHFATLDVFLTFWFVYASYFIVILYKNVSVKNIIKAGVLTGIATGTKYNGIFAIGIYPFIYLFDNLKFNLAGTSSAFLIKLNKALENIKQLFVIKNLSLHVGTSVLVFLIAIVVLVISTPNIIFNWDTFISNEYGKGVMWQIQDNSRPVNFNEYPNHLLKITTDLFFNLNPVIFIAMFYGIYLIITKGKMLRQTQHDKNIVNSKPDLYAIIIFSIIYFAYFSLNNRAGPRFWVPLYPFIVMFAAFGLLDFSKYIKNTKAKIGVLLIILLIPAMSSLIQLAKSDTRTIFINKYVRNDDRDKKIKIYTRSEKMEQADFINVLGLKPRNKQQVIAKDSLLVTERPNLDSYLQQIEVIDNKNRPGPTLYVYKYVDDYVR